MSETTREGKIEALEKNLAALDKQRKEGLAKPRQQESPELLIAERDIREGQAYLGRGQQDVNGALPYLARAQTIILDVGTRREGLPVIYDHLIRTTLASNRLSYELNTANQTWLGAETTHTTPGAGAASQLPIPQAW